MDEKKLSLITLRNLSKAFDSEKHDLFLNKHKVYIDSFSILDYVLDGIKKAKVNSTVGQSVVVREAQNVPGAHT